MNVWRDDKGLHSHVRVEWRAGMELAEVADTSPAAYARKWGVTVDDLLSKRKVLKGMDEQTVKRRREQMRVGEDPEVVEYTRLWLSVVGYRQGEDVAGRTVTLRPYACVVGELFTGEVGDVRRPLVLLDETDGADMEDTDARRRAPDLEAFMQALTWLKDVYHGPEGPVRMYVDRAGDVGNDDGTGAEDVLVAQLRRRRGLTWYPEGEDWEHHERYPAFWTTDTIAQIVPPVASQAGLAGAGAARLRLDALLSHDQLTIRPHCAIAIGDRDWQATGVAIGQVALALEYLPWVEDINASREQLKGYDIPSPQDLEDAAREVERRRRAHPGLLLAGSTPGMLEALRRRRQDARKLVSASGLL